MSDEEQFNAAEEAADQQKLEEELGLDVEYGNEDVTVSGMDVYTYNMKIPKDRIAALIGVKGASKRELEGHCRAKIAVDSKEGDIVLTGRDAIKLYELREVIKAIGRGFSPEHAMLLLRADYMLDLINLRDYGADNKNKLMRIRSRVIGTGGKARRTIETLTDTNLSVYGKTIGILGEVDKVGNAKRAIEMIISGSMHSTVYKWLEGQRRKARLERQGRF